MRRERIVVALLLLPSFFWLVAMGGWLYNLVITVILMMAAVEYGKLFQHAGYRPSLFLLGAGAALLSISRSFPGSACTMVLSSLILLVMVRHLVAYERGDERSGTDFAITLSGIVYIGWIGSHLITLRALEGGLWWILLILPVTWVADSGAYMVGSRWGRHRLAPRLSPNKTWEGYIAGVVIGTVVGAALGGLWQIGAGNEALISIRSGGVVALAISILATFGDLGVSMFKRQLHVKDTGKLLPGHGGALDRIDTWIWAAVLGETVVSLLSL